MKKNSWIYIIVIIIIIGGCVGYLLYNKDKSNNNTQNNVEENDESYIDIGFNDKKISRKDYNLTDYAKINTSKIIKDLNIVILDIIEPDFQFETHYLLCFDADGNKLFDARDFKDNDNDNNRYKFNGKFEYDEKKNILSFNTELFLGENDESTGTAFNDKELSKLTKDEKKKLGNYSDVVKYEYKFDNKKFTFVKKTEVSKLKDNAYYKNILN